ncbi:MAG TPA: hypothetical protein VMO47_16135 [Rhodothermales bacterium]|nr:hypothetical protein [Rhodothermales bacterium]
MPGPTIMFSGMALLFSCLSCAMRAQDFSGTYTVASPQGVLRLTLDQTADDVAGILILPGNFEYRAEGTVVVDDEDGEVSVEGSLSSPHGRGDFTLDGPDEDGDYYLLITPYDASGIPVLAQAATYLVKRAEADAPPAGNYAESGDIATGQPAPEGVVRDSRLVGVWATQVIMNTPSGGMATQILMEIRADGTLIDLGSRSVGGAPGIGIDTGFEAGGETASWRTQGNVLLVSQHGSPWVQLAQFEVADDRLLLNYHDGDRKLWYRQ